MEDNAAGGGRRWPKFPGWLRKNVGPQEQTGCEERAARELPGQPLTTGRDALALADWVESKDGDRKLARRDDELETTGRMLAAREEELLGGARPSEECVDRLWRDLEVLKLRALTAVQQSFTCDDADHLAGHLSDAVAAVRLQEELDRRWAGSDHAPWRPLKCLASHNALLADVAESRLEEAARDGERDRALRLSTPVKRRVCGMGKRVKADLLRCARLLRPCYGPHLDVLNIYAGLCLRSFSARLSGAIRGGLEADDCAYLLFWVNTFYPQEILQHEELRDKLKTACLGALLQRDEVRRLEERYLSGKEERVSSWLLRVLRREEEKWSGASTPEVLGDDYFCPLAVDVIQVIDGSLADMRCHLGDDGAGSPEVAAHLERFLLRYQKSLEKLAQRKDERASAWMKAHLACEEQLREYVGSQVAATQRGRRSCEAILGALRDSALSALTRPIHEQLKVYYRRLWTPGWSDGSLAVTDSLLDSLFELFGLRLSGLKASCRQSLVRTFQRELVSEYVRRMSKGRLKSAEERAGAAGRLSEDADKMDDFFHAAAGCGDGSRSAPMLRHLANAVRLHRPDAVRQEIVAFAGKFPGFSEAALSALLALKSDISAADVGSIKRGVEEELASANGRRPPLAWLKRAKSH